MNNSSFQFGCGKILRVKIRVEKDLENLTWKIHCATQEFLNTWFCEFALEEELDIGKEECVLRYRL